MRQTDGRGENAPIMAAVRRSRRPATVRRFCSRGLAKTHKINAPAKEVVPPPKP